MLLLLREEVLALLCSISCSPFCKWARWWLPAHLITLCSLQASLCGLCPGLSWFCPGTSQCLLRPAHRAPISRPSIAWITYSACVRLWRCSCNAPRTWWSSHHALPKSSLKVCGKECVLERYSWKQRDVSGYFELVLKQRGEIAVLGAASWHCCVVFSLERSWTHSSPVLKYPLEMFLTSCPDQKALWEIRGKPRANQCKYRCEWAKWIQCSVLLPVVLCESLLFSGKECNWKGLP